MIVVSFYTPSYADEAQGLIATCQEFGLRHDVRAVPSLGTWERNTQHKAVFMRSMLGRHTEDVLWLDADARVRQCPQMLEWLDADVAVHYREGYELLSGTLWMRPSDRTRRLCDSWVNTCERFPDMWDQQALDRAIKGAKDIRVFNLPAPYALIFDTMEHEGPAVVEHRQASRRLRKTA